MQIPLQLSLHRAFDAERSLSLIRTTGDWVGLRYIREVTHQRSYRNEKPELNSIFHDEGVMIEVLCQGHFGYAGTSDLSDQGIQRAAKTALALAQAANSQKIFSFSEKHRPPSRGTYQSPFYRGLDTELLSHFSETLMKATRHLKVSEKIISAVAETFLVETLILYVSSNGAKTEQNFLLVNSNFAATAKEGSETQMRTDRGFKANSMQCGLEVFDPKEIFPRCERIGREALELLAAPNCPKDTRDLLIAPDQMYIQIHESIGHPLELDRILGDERNFAGWSFVKPEDFGKLRYGSELMNVTFDPTVPGEFASYSFDDCGNPAKKEYLIKNGILERGLGSLESQERLKLPGVANFRASSWNRAPIDRMANINVEPGSTTMQEMIESTERGIYVEANVSWSIDDYRRKFQFGCEYGRLIEDGKFTKIVKNPNYRGISVPFWNSLKYVGRADEVQMMGTPYCGKGEPSQIIRVGHSSPPCLFSQVEVFGGES